MIAPAAEEKLLVLAGELAHRLHTIGVPRPQAGRSGQRGSGHGAGGWQAVGRKGVPSACLAQVNRFLEANPDLVAFETFLEKLPNLDRLAPVNRKNPTACYATLARELKRVLERNRGRSHEELVFFLGWTKRLLHGLAED